MVEHGDIRVVHRGGSKINSSQPVVTNDSRFLLCASGERVKVFSTSTEECVHDLRGHTDLVTGVLLRPTNHLQVYSCSLDGTVRLWDFTDGILIKSGDQLVEAQDLSAVLSDVSSNPAATGFGRGVYFFKKQKSYRFSLKEDNKKGGKNTLVCLACHPKDDCIATGHEDGKIRLWRNFNQKKEYTYTTMHWHHNAVSSLCFTPEGTNLLSGGVESVLVQWRYKQESERDFLPRLGSAITHIALDIVQQEYIHELGLQQFEVVSVAFDAPGNWMATVEERKPKAAEPEINLKLWAFDEQTQSFVLNTTVSAPHEARVTAVCFSPAADSQTSMLVSTSADGHFKAWRLPRAARAEETTRCGFTLDYFLARWTDPPESCPVSRRSLRFALDPGSTAGE
ncbi:WD repeat-containing protein 75 [Liparis tanakae]|uniref:WD repeat-containing protein 75 n=1 Tax=Liparis tanakae TaxID=230148 RepID=A0A4Z2G4X1_9TELE|nr:WD repeat-containing protein 75 [Liparis tanakae]